MHFCNFLIMEFGLSEQACDARVDYGFAYKRMRINVQYSSERRRAEDYNYWERTETEMRIMNVRKIRTPGCCRENYGIEREERNAFKTAFCANFAGILRKKTLKLIIPGTDAGFSKMNHFPSTHFVKWSSSITKSESIISVVQIGKIFFDKCTSR